MKIATVVLFATGALAAAKAHRHRHRHAPHALLNREASPAADVVTVVVYSLNGAPISEAEVMEGIHNGTLIWGDDGPEQATSAPAYTSTPTPTPSSAAVKVAQYSHYQAPSSSPAAVYSAAPAPSSSYAQGNGGVDTPFPSGLPCDKFPTGYGAVPVDYMGLGGWIGIQNPGYDGSDGYDDIYTFAKGTCQDSSCAKDGMFLSYSCPPGYGKASWPKRQGKTMQSVGGLLCKNGQLEMGDGSIAKTLCVKGSDAVTVNVVNKMKQCSSICRTDYPGTEAETVPVYIPAGGSEELFCPNSNDYYQWQGKGTSAQYYVNPKGVEPQDACWWGNPGTPTGNYAPLNIGLGYSGGKTWISLFQNAPTTDAKLDYSIEITSTETTETCKYSNGQYCGINGCNDSAGCTLGVTGGELTVTLT